MVNYILADVYQLPRYVLGYQERKAPVLGLQLQVLNTMYVGQVLTCCWPRLAVLQTHGPSTIMARWAEWPKPLGRLEQCQINTSLAAGQERATGVDEVRFRKAQGLSKRGFPGCQNLIVHTANVVSNSFWVCAQH